MNTSSRMMSFGEEQKIHVSKVTGDLLPKDFKVTERGQIEVKGKGAMTTCWVEDRVGRSAPVKDEVGPGITVDFHFSRNKYCLLSRSWLSIRPRSRGRIRRKRRKRRRNKIGNGAIRLDVSPQNYIAQIRDREHNTYCSMIDHHLNIKGATVR